MGVQALALAVLAVVLARAATAVKLPAIVGMIVAGVIVRASAVGAELDGPALADVSGEVRLAVLAVVLLRAGLGIGLEDVRRAGGLAVRLGVLPMLADAIVVAAAAVVLLDVRPLVACVLGLVVAPISPAITIPGLLVLRGRHGEAGPRRVLTALLVGAPLDNIVALVLLGLALDAALVGDVAVGPALAGAGISVVGGVVLGAAVGVLFASVLRRIGPRGPAGALLTWAVAGALIVVGSHLGTSFVLAIVALGIAMRRITPEIADDHAAGLAAVWRVAQYALFGLIGYAVDLAPLADVGVLLVAAVVLGQLGRAAGSLLASARSGIPWPHRWSAVAAYVPKATIQAAFAGLALDRGLEGGELILTAGVLAIVITAPLGAITLHRGADRLLA